MHELNFWIKALKIEINEIQLEKGVIEFSSTYKDGLSLNHYMKTPTRILFRIKKVRCKDFPKLFKIISSISWDQFGNDFSPKWEISTTKSRLSIKNRIKSTCEDGFKKYYQKKELNLPAEGSQNEQKILLRLVDDNLTISVDTSGEASFKRGIRTYTEEAPIRENIAACLIWELLNEELLNSSSLNLWDPMAGTGCFLFEAIHLLKPISHKKFLFQNWKKNKNSSAKKIDISENKFNLLLGSDLSKKSINSANSNLANLIKTYPDYNADCIGFKELDFLKSKDPFEEDPYNIIVNPPYNMRIKTSTNPYLFFQAILDHIGNLENCKKAGIIIPKLKGWKAIPPKGWNLEKVTMGSNGGIPIFFHIINKN